MSASHARYEELVVGHALSALEPDDEQELLRHLPACAACERDLALHQETLGHLAHAVDQPAPPSQLWEAIRRQVEAESGPEAFSLDGRPAGDPGVPARPEGAGSVVDLATARSRRAARRKAGAWASVAAAVVLVGSVSLVGLMRGDDARPGVSAFDAAVRQVVEQAPGQIVPLSVGGDKALVVAVVQADQVSLIVDGLPANDRSSSIYVLWGQSGSEKARALGTFDVDGAVDVVAAGRVPTGVDMPSLFVITREDGRTAPDVAHGPAVATGRRA